MWFKYFASTLLLAVVICCVPNSFAKEVGPTSDNANKYPFLVSVRVDGIHLCTGTIVRPSWILIASSCIPPMTYTQRISIQVGVQELSLAGRGMIPVSKLATHSADIALLGLSYPITYNDKVSAVVLPPEVGRWEDEPINLVGKNTTLVGWTLNMNQTTYSFGDVQAVTLKVEDNEQCAMQPSKSGISSANICTKYEGKETSHPCFVFGGPLMYDGVQVGIASKQPAADFCALPIVFTKISSYVRWIKMVAGEL